MKVAPNVELVVRMAATIGNYDYLFDWIFNDAAEIEVRVGATGIDALKGVATQTMSEASAHDDTRFGTLVAPNLVAVNHDHYFNFRLDLDVDGPSNSVNRGHLPLVRLPADSARRSVYVVERQIAETETAATIDTHDPVPAPHHQRAPHQRRGQPGVLRSARLQPRAADARSGRLAGEACRVSSSTTSG